MLGDLDECKQHPGRTDAWATQRGRQVQTHQSHRAQRRNVFQTGAFCLIERRCAWCERTRGKTADGFNQIQILVRHTLSMTRHARFSCPPKSPAAANSVSRSALNPNH